MTPVIKSFFTDTGMEITNDAIQVFGGYGYTKDQVIEQLFRDNRITPIYEGTNSIQAIDLVYRKILNNKIFDKYISQINDEIKKAAKNKNLSLFAGKLEKYIELLVNFTSWIQKKYNTSKDDVSSACNDYLKVLGYISLGYSWLKILRISHEKLQLNRDFFEDKINTATYYFDKILPRVQGHYIAAISGSQSIMKTKFN